MSGEKQRKRTATFNLVAIGAIAVLPLLGSTLLYLFWSPSRFVNYGDLLEPPVVISAAERAAAGLQGTQGKWLFLTIDAGACDEYCWRKLYIIRQVRLTQGKDMDRIERVWMIDDGAAPAPDLGTQYAGTFMLPGARSILDRLGGSAARDHIFIVDPLGNVVLRYPRDPDPSRVKKDLSRLLRASRIG